MDNVATIKEGFMNKTHPTESLFAVSVWHRRYFVLSSNGLLDYYKNYTKKPEEHMGTLLMKDCQDMVAPITVGKKHNVIKLSVKKGDKMKEYWLDCECPPVLNEWVCCLAKASGLVAEDSSGTGKIATIRHSRSLTTGCIPDSKPRPLRSSIDNGEEYETPRELIAGQEEQEEYEEINSRPLTPSLISKGPQSNEDTIRPKINTTNLLKRNIIPSHLEERPTEEEGPPLPPRPYKSQPTLHNNFFGTTEWKNKLDQRRQDVHNGPLPEENGDDDGYEDRYEEVEFSTNVIVGQTKGNKNSVKQTNGPQYSISVDSSDSLLDSEDDELTLVSPQNYLDFESARLAKSEFTFSPPLPPKDIPQRDYQRSNSVNILLSKEFITSPVPQSPMSLSLASVGMASSPSPPPLPPPRKDTLNGPHGLPLEPRPQNHCYDYPSDSYSDQSSGDSLVVHNQNRVLPPIPPTKPKPKSMKSQVGKPVSSPKLIPSSKPVPSPKPVPSSKPVPSPKPKPTAQNHLLSKSPSPQPQEEGIGYVNVGPRQKPSLNTPSPSAQDASRKPAVLPKPPKTNPKPQYKSSLLAPQPVYALLEDPQTGVSNKVPPPIARKPSPIVPKPKLIPSQ